MHGEVKQLAQDHTAHNHDARILTQGVWLQSVLSTTIRTFHVAGTVIGCNNDY